MSIFRCLYLMLGCLSKILGANYDVNVNFSKGEEEIQELTRASGGELH